MTQNNIQKFNEADKRDNMCVEEKVYLNRKRRMTARQLFSCISIRQLCGKQINWQANEFNGVGIIFISSSFGRERERAHEKEREKERPIKTREQFIDVAACVSCC